MIWRRVTLLDYVDLKDYWAQHPRADWLVAAWMKYRPPPRAMRRIGASSRAVTQDAPMPPTGAIAALFQGLGGKKGNTVAMG